MATFIQMVTRIAGDLRRSNLTTEIKNAINDAINEAGNTRFFFNEFTDTVSTLADTEEYPNPFGMVEIDYAFRNYGGFPSSREPLTILNDRVIDRLTFNGTPQLGIPQNISMSGGQYRLEPIPDGVHIILVKGYGRSTAVLTADASTNVWLNEGELYIRALAKRNVLRDVVRDYGEATVLDAIAEDYKQQLVEATNQKNSISTLRATSF